MHSSGRIGKAPGIFIDTNVAQEKGFLDPFNPNPVPSPTSPSAASLPSLRISSSGDDPPLTPIHPVVSQKSSNRSNESRKLLAHVLGQLSSRALPPTVYDAVGTTTDTGGTGTFASLAGTVKSVKEVVKIGSAKPASRIVVDDEEEVEVDGDFSTNATFELMSQLKDVLMISVSQGWQIFDDGTEEVERPERRSGKSSSPFRRSLHPSGKRSRSPSPAFGGRVKSTELLSRCIFVLSSVVSEDCRFKITSPRPTRPPNALQALTLKVAQFLLHVHRNNPKIVAQIAFALLPAFFTFPVEMHARLLAFYEESILRGILESLREMQGVENHLADVSAAMESQEYNNFEAPMVSIRVEGVEDDDASISKSEWTPWVDSVSERVIGILSANAPLQGPSVYFLASLIPPLFAAIFDNIDFGMTSRSGLDVLHRLHRLLDLVVTAKVDAYLDILEVIAYHTPKARYLAASLLVAVWPKAIGHVTISRALTYSAYLSNSPAMKGVLQDHPHDHQFVPWCFISTRHHPVHECRSCDKTLDGFGLRCPFCFCSVHFDCYDVPAGCHLAKYSMTHDANVQKVALYRFSDVLASRRDSGPLALYGGGHTFRYVNIFSLCLCTVCREPLWGCHSQGLRCMSCLQFVHSGCATEQVHACRSFEYDSSHMSIEWKTLRHSCIEFYGDILQLTREDLLRKSYEEISVIKSILWIQLQLLTNGIALGSLVLLQKGRSSSSTAVAEFELHKVLGFCEEILRLESISMSEALDEYLTGARISRSKHEMLFDWTNLVYIASVVKTPYHTQLGDPNGSDLLAVHRTDSGFADTSDEMGHPFELVSLSHLRNALGYEFNIRSDSVATLFLKYLHHLGFFERADRSPELFLDKSTKSIPCVFPLPLGLDLSTDVEMLFAAIESCLTDLDLSVNETGFLLLVRKLPPNNMASDYALARLVRALINWVFAEDDNLATILRDYVAKQQNLPGVQQGRESSWPQKKTRALPTSSVHNGGDYVAARRSLLSHYAVPWLQALHNEDFNAYTNLLFEFCLDLSQARALPGDVMDPAPRASSIGEPNDGSYLDKLLRLLTRLAQHGVVFAVLDDLFARWLEAVASLPNFNGPVPSLVRLFPRDAMDASYRASTIDGSSGQHPGIIDVGSLDLWRPVINAATQNKDGLLRGLHWLYVFARSGVEVSIQTYTHFNNAMSKFSSNVSGSLLFVKAIMSTTWIRATARNDLQDMFATLHKRHLPEILEDVKGGSCSSEVLDFIRLTLGTCLILYGCDRAKIQDLHLITKDDTQDLLSRRKLTTRNSIVADPIIIPTTLMEVLSSYLDANIVDITCIVAQFVHMFITESPYLEPHEIDNFILRNGVMLSKCAWALYGIQRDEVSQLRASFLLRTIVVDDQPFRAILKRHFRPGGVWQLRLESVARIFRIILDATSPYFAVEDRLWQSSVSEVFKYFFVALWGDQQEEIRLAAETLAATMLPVHFSVLTSCWTEVLSKSPVHERATLVSFLIQLRPHFPSWQVLSWDVVIETLREDQYDETNDQDGPASAYLSMYGLSSEDATASDKAIRTSDTSLLRVSLLILSLNMLADGVPIDYNNLLQLKHHLIRTLGFSNVNIRPTINGLTFDITFDDTKEVPELAFPCIHELTRLLDAPYTIDPSPYTNVREEGTPLLIGGPMVEVALRLFASIEDITSLPVLTLKSMLEGLGIMIYKQDVEKKMHLKHLAPYLKTATSKALDLLALDINYECRQLALTVVQTFIKTWTGHGLRSFVNLAIEQVAKLIISQSHSTQDALVAQSKTFIESTLSQYSNNATLVVLLRRPIDREVFVVLRQVIDNNAKTSPQPGIEPLRERLLRDTLPRAVDTNQADFQTMLNNLLTYVEVVYHQGYSAEMMMFVGQQLTQLARKSAEFSPHVVKPSPLLSIATILIQHNKALSRDMLTYTDAVLRIILNRLEVDTASLSRLIQVTSTLYRRTQSSDANAPANAILAVIFELLGDGLRMKARVLPSTIKAMFEALMNTEIAGHATPATLYQQEYPNLADNGFTYIQNSVWMDTNSDSDFSASLMIANFILQAASQDPSVMSRIVEQTLDRSSSLRQSMTVRAWNVLLLAALMDPTEVWIDLMYRQLHAFAIAHQNALRGYLQSGTSIPESAIADIDHAYIAIKLWLIVAQKRASKEDEGSVTSYAVWNELWPPFESLVNLFEREVQAGLSIMLATTTWSTVAELFIFVRTLHSPIAIQSISHIALLNRLMTLGRGEQNTKSNTTNKILRALRALSEPAPEVGHESLINQATKELITAEKLRVLKARQEVGRGIPERRNARGPSTFV